MIQRRPRVVHDQEHSPSSTGTTDSGASNSATKGLPEHSQEKADEEDDDDDQSTLIDVETVTENAPVRVSVIVENPNRIT